MMINELTPFESLAKKRIQTHLRIYRYRMNIVFQPAHITILRDFSIKQIANGQWKYLIICLKIAIKSFKLVLFRAGGIRKTVCSINQ